MKKLMLVLAMMITSAYAAEPPKFVYDPNSPAALETKAKHASYERDGQALRTSDLYAELARLDGAKKARIAFAKPDELLAAALLMNDDDMRSMSYATALQKRGEGGDPYASFFYAVRQWEYCAQLDRQQGDGWAKSAKECWQGVMPAFKRASDAQIADASFNIAKLYANGSGVSTSKLAAAEWYVKAADQYNKEKSRDEALTSVEKALDLVPDHPAALRLRKSMLK